MFRSKKDRKFLLSIAFISQHFFAQSCKLDFVPLGHVLSLNGSRVQTRNSGLYHLLLVRWLRAQAGGFRAGRDEGESNIVKHVDQSVSEFIGLESLSDSEYVGERPLARVEGRPLARV